jgi:hypothetical protein
MTDLTKTKQELINEVAYSKLRVVGTGQPLEAEYSAEIENKIDPLLAQLSGDRICHIGNSDAIPVELFDAVAGLLANICLPMTGKQFAPQIKDYYEAQLKRVTSNRTTYETTQAEYF